MIGRVTALAIAGLAMTGIAAASELAPGDGHSIHLGRFNGSVHYTIEQDGYRVVATLASGAEDLPIRFVATLGPGQSMTISVPQAVGEPSLDFEIVRTGEALLVADPISAQTADRADETTPVRLR
jgi:hypothetical protein